MKAWTLCAASTGDPPEADRRVLHARDSLSCETLWLPTFIAARQVGAGRSSKGQRERRLITQDRRPRDIFDRTADLMRDYPDVAEAGLLGGISVDKDNGRIVGTYAKLTRPQPNRLMTFSPARIDPWDRFSQ